MKLAEALQERADIQRRLAQLKDRLRSNARVQEGETPAEEPEALLSEMDALFARLEHLIIRINLTNSAVAEEGVTLTELIARRDCLERKIQMLREFLNTASDVVSRALRSEIRILSTVKVADKRRQLDRLCKEYRELDSKIQQINWLTDLR